MCICRSELGQGMIVMLTDPILYLNEYQPVLASLGIKEELPDLVTAQIQTPAALARRRPR